MNYEDYKDAKRRVAEDREYIRRLSDEQYAAFDIAKQIKKYEFQLEMAKEQLKRLKKAAKRLPTPNAEKVEDIPTAIVDEGGYRFRGKRDLERKLYGYPKATE